MRKAVLVSVVARCCMSPHLADLRREVSPIRKVLRLEVHRAGSDICDIQNHDRSSDPATLPSFASMNHLGALNCVIQVIFI